MYLQPWQVVTNLIAGENLGTSEIRLSSLPRFRPEIWRSILKTKVEAIWEPFRLKWDLIGPAEVSRRLTPISAISFLESRYGVVWVPGVSKI